MRFWDSSAIVPLCLKESSSGILRRLIAADEDMVVWWATRVECQSALARRREGVFSEEAEHNAKAILSALAEVWSEVQPGERLRQRAERLLLLHPLRATDAFQLSAALIWAEDTPRDQVIVCLDHNLREAARKEGFTILPEKF